MARDRMKLPKKLFGVKIPKESLTGAASNTAATVARAVDGLLGYLQAGNQRPHKRKAEGLKRRGKKRRNASEARAHH
jgi:hypothetical protein